MRQDDERSTQWTPKGSEIRMNLPANKSRWPSWAVELYEERCGIMEFSGNLSRETAETRAEQDVRKEAWTRDREGKERVSA